MAKKRVKNPKKKRNTMIALVVTTLIAAGLIALAVINHLNTGYIFTINNKRVPLREYQIHQFMQRMSYENIGFGEEIWNYTTDEGVLMYDLARQKALESLQDIKTIVSKADEYGVVATSEDKAEAKTQAETFINTVNMYYGTGFFEAIRATNAHVEKVFLEGILAEKIYDEATKDFVLDEAEFEEAFNQYLEEAREDYTYVDVNYIQVADLDTAKTVQDRINADEDFDTLMVEYSVDYDAEAEDPMAVVRLGTLGVSDDVLKAAVDMEAGTVSAFEENADGYVMFRVSAVYEEDRAVVEEAARESFTASKKSEIFAAKSAEWKEEADIVVFEKVYENTLLPGLGRPIPVEAQDALTSLLQNVDTSGVENPADADATETEAAE